MAGSALKRIGAIATLSSKACLLGPRSHMVLRACPQRRRRRRTLQALTLRALTAIAAVVLTKAARSDAEDQGSSAPHLDTTHPAASFEGTCLPYNRICFDQGTIVSYDPLHSPTSRKNKPIPKLNITGLSYNWGGAPQPDRLRFSRFNFEPLTFRPASGQLEGTPELRSPTFSAGTVPVLMWSTWPHSLAEFFNHVPARVWALQEAGAMSRDVTLVVGTPPGERVPPFASTFLKPFTPYEVVSFAEFSERHPPANAPRTSAEGTPQRCFETAFLCAFGYGYYPGAYGAAQAIYRYYKPHLLPAPLKFDGGEQVLKVLIERRRGPVRNLMNSQFLQDLCNDPASWQGLLQEQAGQAPGGISRVQCRQCTFTNDSLANMAAVRASDVLVVVHGAGCTNWLFMREGSAMLELRPYQFGLQKVWVENLFPAVGEAIGHKVHHYALNIEDPDLFRPSLLEEEHPVPPSNSRYNKDLRDRHVRLPFDAFRTVLQRIAAAGRSRERYLQQRDQGLALVDLLPGGQLHPAEPLPEKLKIFKQGLEAMGAALAAETAHVAAAAAWPVGPQWGVAASVALAGVLVWRWQGGRFARYDPHAS